MAQKFGSEEGKLIFGEFNYPVNGENLLASVDYDTIKLFSKGQSSQDVFWFPSTTSWYSAATKVLQVCQSNFDSSSLSTVTHTQTHTVLHTLG